MSIIPVICNNYLRNSCRDSSSVSNNSSSSAKKSKCYNGLRDCSIDSSISINNLREVIYENNQRGGVRL